MNRGKHVSIKFTYLPTYLPIIQQLISKEENIALLLINYSVKTWALRAMNVQYKSNDKEV